MSILSAVADLVVILAVHSGLLSAVADIDKFFWILLDFQWILQHICCCIDPWLVSTLGLKICISGWVWPRGCVSTSRVL